MSSEEISSDSEWSSESDNEVCDYHGVDELVQCNNCKNVRCACNDLMCFYRSNSNNCTFDACSGCSDVCPICSDSICYLCLDIVKISALDRDSFLQTVSVNGHTLKFASNEFLHDYSIIIAAVKNCLCSLKYIPVDMIDYNIALEWFSCLRKLYMPILRYEYLELAKDSFKKLGLKNIKVIDQETIQDIIQYIKPRAKTKQIIMYMNDFDIEFIYENERKRKRE